MHDIFYFVDKTVPGLSGADLLRLGKLATQRVPSPATQRQRDIGLDRGAS